MFGAIIGDIVGSRFEFDNCKSKKFELFTNTCDYTDDTVMTLAVAKALLLYETISDMDAFKRELVRVMHEVGMPHPHCGYGGRFCTWMMKNYTEPYGSFGKDSRSKYSKEISLYQDIAEQVGLISQQEESIADYEEQLTIISEKLDGDDVREQVKKLNAQIRACTDTITKRRDEQQQLLRKQGAFEEEKRQKENSRSELSLLDKNNQMIELYKAYTQRIYDELNAEYKQKEALIRTKLQMYINEIFSRYFYWTQNG